MNGDTLEAKQGGITVGGQNFIFLNTEESGSVYGRKGVDTGVCSEVPQTRTHALGIQSENCNAVVMKPLIIPCNISLPKTLCPSRVLEDALIIYR